MYKRGNVIILPTAKKQAELRRMAMEGGRKINSGVWKSQADASELQKQNYEILASSWKLPASILDQ